MVHWMVAALIALRILPLLLVVLAPRKLIDRIERHLRDRVWDDQLAVEG
jgi:hypothetical protein